MYAVIQSGGKQYRVQPGDYLQVEKLEGDVGSSLAFNEVLFIREENIEKPLFLFGKPYLSGALVEGEILAQGRGDKLLIIKMKRRKQYRRTQGHRQNYTQLLVTGISSGDTSAVLHLSAEEKEKKRNQFQSQLKPKGNAFTPALLGSREKRRRKNLEALKKAE